MDGVLTDGTVLILPDGREVPIFRPAGANVIEQKRITELPLNGRNPAELVLLAMLRIDVVLVEFSLGEPDPDLRFSELAACQEGEAGDVRPVGAVRHQCVSGARYSVISIAVPQGSTT